MRTALENTIKAIIAQEPNYGKQVDRIIDLIMLDKSLRLDLGLTRKSDITKREARKHAEAIIDELT